MKQFCVVVSFPSSEHVKQSPKTKTPRAVTLWRHACLTTPVVKTSPPQTPSEQTATTPKPSSFRNLRRQAGPPTGVAATLSRSDCTGRVALAELRGILSHPQERRHEEGAQSIFLNDFIRPGHSGLETCGRVAGLAIGTCAPGRRSVLLVSGKGGAGCNIGVSGRGSA